MKTIERSELCIKDVYIGRHLAFKKGTVYTFFGEFIGDKKEYRKWFTEFFTIVRS